MVLRSVTGIYLGLHVPRDQEHVHYEFLVGLRLNLSSAISRLVFVEVSMSVYAHSQVPSSPAPPWKGISRPARILRTPGLVRHRL